MSSISSASGPLQWVSLFTLINNNNTNKKNYDFNDAASARAAAAAAPRLSIERSLVTLTSQCNRIPNVCLLCDMLFVFRVLMRINASAWSTLYESNDVRTRVDADDD